MTVSSPIDTPAKSLAPITAPPDANTPAAQAATLRSLEQMIDLSAVKAASYDEPAVVQNDFAPRPEPFRLATRKTLAAPDDPQLKKKTLAALGSMMSSDAPAAARR